MPAKNTTRREPWNPLLKGYPFSEKVNAVSVGAETLFTRLVAQADDFGNYYGNPKQILAYLYGHRFAAGHVTATDTGRWRAELVSNPVGPLAAIYEVNGAEYIHLMNPRRRIRSDVAPDERFPREPANIQEQATSEHVTRTGRKRTVNGSLDLDQDLDADQENIYADTDSVIDYLNEKAKSEFKHSKHSREHIHGRLAESFTSTDCKLVIDFKVSEWLGDPEWSKYLTPVTLFRPSKFENNLNAAKRWESKGCPSKNGKGETHDRDASVYENAFNKEAR